MKKIKLTVFSLSLLYGVAAAQNTAVAEPTTGSLSNYINTAVSPATGVPNIGFPIYQLESIHKDLPVNIALSYHVYNAKAHIPASEVGQGWSMFSSGMITRQIVSQLDEITDSSSINEEQADIFFYNIPGHSGKFKILKDAATGNFMVSNLTGEKIRIDYERNTSSSKFIINTFTITDDLGYQYLFQDYNVGVIKDISFKNYKTSFFLTKVKDPNGTEFINYSYDKKIKYMGTSSIMKYQYCKINTISTAKGKLKFSYLYDQMNDGEIVTTDPYTLTAVSLTDPADRLISKYQFTYGTSYVLEDNLQGTPSWKISGRKALTGIQKLDKNLAPTEETLFEYDADGSDRQYGYYSDTRYGNFLCEGTQPVNPKKYTVGLLKKITFPTKGSVVYNFEANMVYVDKTAPDYAQSTDDLEINYYDTTNVIPFDTNTSSHYSFTVTGGYQYLIPGVMEVYNLTNPHGDIIPFTYTVRNAANQTLTKDSSCSTVPIFTLFPGTYTVRMTGGGNGFLSLYKKKTMPAPYRNEHPVNAGARVEKIQSFDENGVLVKTKTFDYQLFSDASSSGGTFFQNELGDPSGFLLYKNVKETEIAGTENNGYIKYYFKTPYDYILPTNTGYAPYYNLTSQGILEKKEVYNKLNQKTESSLYEYTFQEIPGVPESFIELGSTKPAWLQYSKQTEIVYPDNNSSYATIKESTFHPGNFQEMLVKTTAQDGIVSEASTKYAADLGNTRLVNKNMLSVPLQTEVKADGTVMTRITTKYDSSSHFYPTSIETTDLNQTAETSVTFDLYDSNGNLVQTTDKAGNSVTTIWGYQNSLPIAQIAGAKYSDISSLSVISAAISASNADAADPANEGALLTALNALRTDYQLQQYSITAYTYDPLVGVTNSVSPNGIRNTFQYDDSGRLLRVKNSEGQVIKENQYNYKH